VAKPRDTHAIADSHTDDGSASRNHSPDYFMTRSYRVPNVGQLTIQQVKVGTADSTGQHL
jgi:hypothetical protein